MNNYGLYFTLEGVAYSWNRHLSGHHSVLWKGVLLPDFEVLWSSHNADHMLNVSLGKVRWEALMQSKKSVPASSGMSMLNK